MGEQKGSIPGRWQVATKLRKGDTANLRYGFHNSTRRSIGKEEFGVSLAKLVDSLKHSTASRGLFSNRPQITVEPIEGFFDLLLLDRHMARVEQDVTLILFRSSQ